VIKKQKRKTNMGTAPLLCSGGAYRLMDAHNAYWMQSLPIEIGSILWVLKGFAFLSVCQIFVFNTGAKIAAKCILEYLFTEIIKIHSKYIIHIFEIWLLLSNSIN
jgi:hypothetical protein